MSVTMTDVSFGYTKHDLILNRLNLSVNDGEIVAILGASGSGKSTLLGLLTGVLAPKSGNIKMHDAILADETTFLNPEERNIGMLFQDYALFPHMNVIKNVGFGVKGRKENKHARVQEMLELVNLKGYESRYPYELSGGQQQRVALARALAPKPRLLLLDEPFSHLDADLKSSIRQELKSIIKKTHTTALLVTHDMEDAKAMADRIIVLK